MCAPWLYILNKILLINLLLYQYYANSDHPATKWSNFHPFINMSSDEVLIDVSLL